MGRKLAGIFGIVAATLAFGIGTAVEAGQSNDFRSIQQVVADDKGPTIVGTQGTDDDKGPTLIGTHVLADDKGPTVVARTITDGKGPTVIGTQGTDDDKGPTSPVM
ncbi:hypothetical protein OH786_04725 [Streptomyces atratus]|uniref:DUF5666 domain-containing protein n=1 Tax=Streptomyces atratus TaxID=1893 RepID=A0A1K2F1V2_STRAR|nr:hypothetical protein [Streptomyces atratus]SFY41350.1 hypothetical protein SAMN02787144_102750 [Streptomyces atratus]